MKSILTKCLMVLSGTLALSGPATATTTVTSWSYTTATPSTSLAPTAGATTVAAFNIGGAASALGGVNFSAANAGFPGTTIPPISLTYSVVGVTWASGAAGAYGANAVLNTFGYTYPSNNGLLEFSGLTVGQTYTFQFIAADARTNGPEARTFQIVGGTNSGADVVGSSDTLRYAYVTGEYGVISATFTANEPKAAFYPRNYSPLGVSQGTQINAVHIIAVPEPSAALLGGIGLLGLLRRRRN